MWQADLHDFCVWAVRPLREQLDAPQGVWRDDPRLHLQAPAVGVVVTADWRHPCCQHTFDSKQLYLSFLTSRELEYKFEDIKSSLRLLQRSCECFQGDVCFRACIILQCQRKSKAALNKMSRALYIMMFHWNSGEEVMLGRSKASLCQNYNSVTGKLSNSTFHHLLPSWCFDILKKSSSLFFCSSSHLPICKILAQRRSPFLLKNWKTYRNRWWNSLVTITLKCDTT